MASSLKQKSIKGISWSFVDNIANSGTTFFIGLILARLLSPSEFGLLGMIGIFIAISNSIIDSGFSQALIRKNDVTDVDYSTTFFFNLATSVLLLLVLYCASPMISRYFHEPRLIDVTRAMALLLVFNSFSIIQRVILTKNIDFKLQTKISIISSVVSGLFAIALALRGWGIWSLVGQLLSRQFLGSLLFWLFNSWRPTLQFSRTSFKELFGFGYKLLISGLLDTIYKNLYYLIIGRNYSASLLGQFTRGELFASIFSSNLTAVVQRVSFPVLSSLQNDDIRLKEAFRKVIKMTMLPTFTLMLGLIAVAKPLIIFLIGAKWMMATVFLQIVCLAEMLYPLHAININILNVKGRSDLVLKLEVLKKSIAVPVILAGVFGSIELMLWSSVIASIIAFFLNSHYSAPLLNYSTRDQIKDIAPGFFSALFIAGGMWCLILIILPVWVTLLLQIVTGAVLAFFIFEILKLEEYMEIKRMLLGALHKNK